MATAKQTRPFTGLRCPHCGEVDVLVVKVDDLTLSCSSCDEPTTRDDVRAMLDAWSRLLFWLAAATDPADPT